MFDAGCRRQSEIVSFHTHYQKTFKLPSVEQTSPVTFLCAPQNALAIKVTRRARTATKVRVAAGNHCPNIVKESSLCPEDFQDWRTYFGPDSNDARYLQMPHGCGEGALGGTGPRQPRSWHLRVAATIVALDTLILQASHVPRSTVVSVVIAFPRINPQSRPFTSSHRSLSLYPARITPATGMAYQYQTYSVVPAAAPAQTYTTAPTYDPNAFTTAAPTMTYAAPQYVTAAPAQYAPQYVTTNRDEIRTIFVTGFPNDIRERELSNMCRFMQGFEVRAACALAFTPRKQLLCFFCQI
jgi:hypothetical protein